MCFNLGFLTGQIVLVGAVGGVGYYAYKNVLPNYVVKLEEKFENLDQYKHEDNFKRCLSKLELEDVREAIRRSRTIMEQNQKDGKKLTQYKGFKYYTENPSLTIFEAVEEILKDCGLG